MATLQNLTNQQIDEALYAAAERQVPATINICGENGWSGFRTRMLAVRDRHILLEAPQPENGDTPRPFLPADRVGVTFKFKHHKHVFSATVAEVTTESLDGGPAGSVLHVCSPTRMQRMQRRAFDRVNVPDNRIVRASFWLGGRQNEPAGTTPDQPVWSGRVENISAGGFQAAADGCPADALSTGEAVGVRIRFGVGEETIYTDAQFRHGTVENGKVHLGFQFVGLGLTPETRHALQTIAAKAAQFERENPRTAPAHSRA